MMEHTTAKEPARALALDGACNFRDLGGYRAQDGRRVRWRMLFRADHLAALSQRDLHPLHALGLAHSLDFRGVEESAQTPYNWPGITRHPLYIEPTVVQRASVLLEQGKELTAQHTAELMRETYRSFVHTCAARFARFFELLLTCETPLVFHCTAGKDRTGWAALLLLTALGVDEETILQDYLLTNQLYAREARADSDWPLEALQVLWRVHPSYLQAATDLVRQEFGSLGRYLQAVLGVDGGARQRLKARYLE